MCRIVRILLLCLGLSVGALGSDLPTASPTQLLQVYSQLGALQGSSQWTVTENVTWKRDAATFTFIDGHLTFAEPIAGRVLGAVFEGRGKIELKPPSAVMERQLSRFSKGPKFEDQFQHAVFFFTDDSWEQLRKVLNIGPGGNPVTASQVLQSAQKKYSESFNDWWENRRKGNPPMCNLAARMLADLSDPSSRGFFLADFKGERYGDLLYQVSWNRDSLLLPYLANDEEVMLLHYNRGNYYEWWAGFHLAEEYTKSTRPEHRTQLAHCRHESIETEIDKHNRLSAAASMDFEISAKGVRILPINLNGVLRISSITDPQGAKLSFIQENRDLASDTWMILPEPSAPGKVYSIKITYAEDSTHDSRIVNQRGSGLYYVTSRESWFPSFGAFDDRSQYSLKFRSPQKYKFIATGRLVKSGKAEDFLETEWQSDVPLSVVGFNYGNFVEKTKSDAHLTVSAYAGKEIPDELKSLQTTFDMAELAGGPGGPKNIAGQYGINTGGFNTAVNTAYAAAVSLQALSLFQYYFGSLPYKTISVTEQPVRGYGQSWPTLIFLPYDSLLDATTRNSLRLQDSAEAREFYSLVAVHEMAHQWWGHLVGWKTYHDEWLSEGFAEFSAGLYLRKLDPDKVRSFWDLKRKWLFSKNRAGNRPVDVGPLWLNRQSNAYLEPENSTFLIYYKGAYVLEMLRCLLEDPRSKDPDAKFIAMMRDFATTYANKNATTDDFERIVTKHAGQAMDWFFNQWVYGTEVPEFDFSYSLQPGAGGKTSLQFSLTQSGVSGDFQSRVPIYAFVNDRPTRLGFIKIVGSQTYRGEIPLPFHPEKISLDEFHSILCSMKQ